jgi:hypothetical protein
VTGWKPEFPGYLNPTSELPAANPHSIQLEDLQAMFISGYFDSRNYLKLDTILTPDRIAARVAARDLFDLQELELLKVKPSKWEEFERYKAGSKHRGGIPPKRCKQLGSKHAKVVTAENAKTLDDMMAEVID